MRRLIEGEPRGPAHYRWLLLFPSLPQVLVVDKGRIVERGTHTDLLAADGVYKKLVLRQLSTSEGGGAGFDELDESLLEPAIHETSEGP